MKKIVIFGLLASIGIQTTRSIMTLVQLKNQVSLYEHACDDLRHEIARLETHISTQNLESDIRDILGFIKKDEFVIEFE